MAMDPAGPPNVERLSDVRETKVADERVRFWRAELALADKAEKMWRRAGKRVVEQYRLEAGQPTDVGDGWKAKGKHNYQILWSNTEILKAATFSQMPQPDVSRRWEDQDPLARFAAETLERAIGAHIDPSHPLMGAQAAFERARDDALLPGRGVVRVRYEANIVKQQLQATEMPTGEMDPLTGQPVTTQVYAGPEGQPTEPEGFDEATGQAFVEVKGSERVWIEHVYWEDVRFSPARAWSDVWWVAYRHVMTREELEQHFGAKGREVPLTLMDGTAGEQKEHGRLSKDADSSLRQAIVWEIWSKRHGRVIWLADGEHKILQEAPPPLDLEGFFDCPDPLIMCGSTDTMVPVPLYTQYEDLAQELNLVTTRIAKLVRTIKAVGLYDATVKEMVELADATDGQLKPIDVMGALRDKGGLAGAITWWPIDVQSQALLALLQHREQIKATIFEVTGLSDIMRGQGEASETATAQNLKAQFGNFRLTPMQQPMQRFVRDAMRMLGEVISELFDPQTLAQVTGLPLQGQMDPMTGQPASPGIVDVMPMLRDERMRGFRLDIETDQLVRPDQQQQKAEATEFVSSVTGYLTGVLPLAMQAPPLIPLSMELLKFMCRHYKVGRTT